MSWEEALAWVEARNAESYLGHDDWRLPEVKELQSIVDYTRSPDTTGSAAIDPVFEATAILNEGGQADFPWYWTSSTHASSDGNGRTAVYVAFGCALGWMKPDQWAPCATLMDVHGAGAQRPQERLPAVVPDGRELQRRHGLRPRPPGRRHPHRQLRQAGRE